MMLSLAIAILELQASTPLLTDRLLADHVASTQASIPCNATRQKDEIVVCAARDADRWRVAYIARDPGAPNPDDVPGETSRLLSLGGSNCRNMALSVAGCGMVSISASTSGGRGVKFEQARPLAP